jgi:AraC-like DNA-binding protein
MIRRSDPDAFRLLVALRGRTQIMQGDRESLLMPDSMAFYDTSRPFCGWRQSIASECQLTMLTFPRGLLPLPANLVKSVIGARIAGHSGVGAMMMSLVRRLIADPAQYTTADLTRLSTVALDLMMAVIGHELGDGMARITSPESRRRVLELRIHTFIRERLGDPTLTPRVIAGAHNISLRLLHQMCQEQGTTVAGRIRDARLQRCHDDLSSALLVAWSIQRIAARWGFNNYPHFSRLFRATYGVSP